MTHFTREQWLQFVQGKIDSSHERKMEDHLLSCDQCLATYEETTEPLSPSFDFSVEKPVMAALFGETPAVDHQVKKSPNRIRQRTITHFIISAAAAIMLAGTGVFTTLMEENSIVQGENLKEAPSLTSSLMEQTERFFSQMDPSKEDVE
ncbi:anti-sigma factor family protein [Jeotgalibacillus proteolyticus]|uniref:Zinc-finger domain-containing protein n=1 Tax=Jeotgalibacillus proteolyticus TaxID=2082395 RepID=A0A2S5GCE6_9BACL|nr:hypothetical protein [Jeotgalibacillus proteolyticus]PPA70680.1 hypothetical protein C4B60_07725 [Jeotgalibacillus proteolyticus]